VSNNKTIVEQMKVIEPNSDTVAENSKSAANSAATPLLFDIRAAAQALSMSVVSVRKLVRQRRLKRLENFRKVLISGSELQRFATPAE
jgi:hypothetical protein